MLKDTKHFAFRYACGAGRAMLLGALLLAVAAQAKLPREVGRAILHR